MGSGKTTHGKVLAKRLQYSFLDMDEEIVKKTGYSINTLFEMYGEKKFREMERDYLQETQTFQNVVIATGGGAPCFFNNMEIMNNAGITIYLKMTVGGLVKRLHNAKNERPLVKDKSETELKQFISEAMALRESYYSKAKIIIKGENLNIDTLIAALQLK